MHEFLKRIDRISFIAGVVFIALGLISFIPYGHQTLDPLQQQDDNITRYRIIAWGLFFLAGALAGKPVIQKMFIRKDLNYNNVAIMTLYTIAIGLLITLGIIFYFNSDSLKILLDFAQNIGKEMGW